MGDVYDECVRDLAAWRRIYKDDPRREIFHLLLVGLQREEIVAVAYGEDVMNRRLRTMPISDGSRNLIRHALLWAWKDEEMHAIYIRGAIFRLGSPSLRLRAGLKQMSGALGGWATAVQQHVRWRTAPFSYGLASLVTAFGIVTGQVPLDVRKYLRYGPFRDFCVFNVDAERTAWLCYERLIELLPTQPAATAEMIDDVRRMQIDEERHTRVFETLAAAIDEQDRLAAGESEESLARKFAAIGEYFLPRVLRSSTVAGNPVGSGGRVWVMQGDPHEDKLQVFRTVLESAGLAGRVAERARELGKPIGELRIAIKPAFMLGYHRKDLSPLTDPELIDALAGTLRAQGCVDVVVVEARNLYDRFYRHRSVREVAHYFHIESPHYRLVDLSDEQVPHVYFRGMAQYSAGQTWMDADFRISFGKLRSHPIEMVYLSCGQLEGVGARCDEFIFSERQAHRDTAVMMLLNDFPPHFALLDGYDSAADGILGIMGTPHPRRPRRIYAGADALAVDLAAARHLGLHDLRASPMLRTACDWFGNPSEHTEIIGTDKPVDGWRDPYHNEWSTLLSLLAYPVYEFGSGRGTLFVPEMDEGAFPPAGTVGLPLRIARSSLQMLLGLRHPR
jgi:uncharacterized protein (DUF362 family)